MEEEGTLLDVALTTSPVRHSSGRVIGVSKIALDITPRIPDKSGSYANGNWVQTASMLNDSNLTAAHERSVL